MLSLVSDLSLNLCLSNETVWLQSWCCGAPVLLHLVTGAADDGGEHGPGGVISGEACLHQAGAVITDEGGGLIVVTHGCGFCRMQVRGGGGLNYLTHLHLEDAATYLNMWMWNTITIHWKLIFIF